MDTYLPELAEADLRGYCGLYCGACDALLATARGEEEALARAWGRPPKDVRCWGCRAELTAACCRSCDIRRCARQRTLDHCGLCASFPCQQLRAFAEAPPHHCDGIANLERMKRVGRRQWLEEQHHRWSCPGCSRPASWYDQRCDCGTQLSGYHEAGEDGAL